MNNWGRIKLLLLRPRRVNQKTAKIYYIKCLSAATEETAAIEEKKYFSIAPFSIAATAVEGRRPRNRCRSSRFLGAIEALLYDPRISFQKFQILNFLILPRIAQK